MFVWRFQTSFSLTSSSIIINRSIKCVCIEFSMLFLFFFSIYFLSNISSETEKKLLILFQILRVAFRDRLHLGDRCLNESDLGYPTDTTNICTISEISSVKCLLKQLFHRGTRWLSALTLFSARFFYPLIIMHSQK